MHMRAANYVIADGWRQRGAFAFDAGDARTIVRRGEHMLRMLRKTAFHS